MPSSPLAWSWCSRAPGAVNFAHGEIFAAAAFVGFLLTNSGLNYWAALVLAIAAMTGLGILIERGAYRPLINASDLSLIIATIAVSFMIKGIVRTVYGARGDFVAYPPIFSFEPLVVKGVFISPQHLVMAGAAIICMIVFSLFFTLTRQGKMMQAVSEDKDAAAIVGVDARRVFLWIWVLGALLGGRSRRHRHARHRRLGGTAAAGRRGGVPVARRAQRGAPAREHFRLRLRGILVGPSLLWGLSRHATPTISRCGPTIPRY